jgi:hypothetical protein
MVVMCTPTCQLGLALDSRVSVPVMMGVTSPDTLEPAFLLTCDTSDVSGYARLVVSV